MTMRNKIVKVYVLKGLNGISLVIEDYRVSNEKIYGMLTPIYTFEVATDDILQAIGQKNNQSDDCVSRAEVFEIMGNLMSIPYDFDRPINEDDVSESMDKIKALSPVTLTRKVGKILVNDKYRVPMYECLGCKNPVMEFFKYCPNCGNNMEEQKNE